MPLDNTFNISTFDRMMLDPVFKAAYESSVRRDRLHEVRTRYTIVYTGDNFDSEDYACAVAFGVGACLGFHKGDLSAFCTYGKHSKHVKLRTALRGAGFYVFDKMIEEEELVRDVLDEINKLVPQKSHEALRQWEQLTRKLMRLT